MSVVLVSAMESFIMFMSDGRVSANICGVRVALQEDYKKLLRVNKNVCVGYAGTKEACEKVLNSLNKYNKKDLSLSKIINILYLKAMEVFKENNNNVILMAIGGKNQNSIEFCTFNSKNDFKQDYYKPKGIDMNYITLCPEDIKDDIFLKHLKMNMPLNTLNEYDKAMNDCIDEIASTNNGVNKTKFTEVIKFG